MSVHGDSLHTCVDAGAAAMVTVVDCADRVVEVVPRSHPVGAVLEIGFSRFNATENPSSIYEAHGLSLVGPAMDLDGVEILMILKTMILKVVAIVVFVVLVQCVSVTILDNAVLKAVVEVDMMVRNDAAMKWW